jgi:hypothetical protein
MQKRPQRKNIFISQEKQEWNLELDESSVNRVKDSCSSQFKNNSLIFKNSSLKTENLLLNPKGEVNGMHSQKFKISSA